MKKKKWYKKVSNWLFIIICFILGIFLICNLSIMFQANTNKDKVPSVFGYKPFIVLSGSMETEIFVGDLIIVKEIDPETLTENDVIAFRDAEGTVTTHRIIDIVERNGENYFVTKGDNNNAQDQNLVEYKDVEGIYLMRIPSVGNIMSSLAEPTTALVLVLGVTVIFGAGFMLSSRKQNENERKEFLEYKRQKELAEQAEFEEFKKQKELKEKNNNIKKEDNQSSYNQTEKNKNYYNTNGNKRNNINVNNKKSNKIQK